ncbi:MAG: glycosyltransferase, partial [Nitrospiraceae bacterium]
GFDDLIRALALIREKIPGVRCVMVGGAPRKRYLQRLLDLAERLSVRDRLILVGYQDDVAPFLGVMDLVALPSRTEGFPITILEAMAASRPIVATSVGGVPEAVRDGRTGILVPPGDPRRLAEAIIGLLDSPGLARAMGEEGRKLVESVFTLEAEARQTAQVYRRALAAYPPKEA